MTPPFLIERTISGYEVFVTGIKKTTCKEIQSGDIMLQNHVLKNEDFSFDEFQVWDTEKEDEVTDQNILSEIEKEIIKTL